MLIIGDNRENVQKASKFVERILSSDEATREKIRKEQLSVQSTLNAQRNPGGKDNQNNSISDLYRQAGLDDQKVDNTMMTPYGPPSTQAYIVPVPNDVVGLIIGKNGETIRHL